MSATMIRHQANRDFFQYWNTIRAHAPAPEQKSMDPARIGEALPDVFIIDVAPTGAYEMRLAGTRLCAMWGTELRGMDALALWEGQDREGAEMLFHSVLEDGAVAVVSLEVANERGQTLDVEMVAMPLLRGSGRTPGRGPSDPAPGVKRIIGAFTPWQQPFWLGQMPITRQRIVSVRMVWPEDAPHLNRLSLVAETMSPHAAPGPVDPSRADDRRGSRPSDTAATGADVLADPASRSFVPGDAVNGMPVLARRGHLTLLEGGHTASD